jgi:site-specific recombinase XerD
MFETIFTRRWAIVRHERGPMADERCRYLIHLKERGLSRSALYQRAEYVFWVAHRLKLTPDRRVSLEEINAVAKRWTYRRRPRHVRAKGSGETRKLFRMVARDWLRFINRLIPPPPWPNPYAPLVQEFAEYMQNERGLSEKTITLRCWFVRKFLDRIVEEGWEFRALELKQIDEVLAWQGSQGYTRTGVSSYAGALRAFFKYCESRGWCRPGIATAIAGPRLYRDEGLPAGPSWVEVQQLLASTRTNRPADIRDRAILMLLATYGLRAGEVRGLQLDSLDWDHERIIVRRSKQHCAHVYPLGHSVGEAILRYLKAVRPRVSDRTLFLTLVSPYRPLARGSLWPVVGERLRKLGIVVPHPGPHCLRHACAARLLAKGFSLKEIGDHLGHRSMDATRIYAKIDLPALRRVARFDLGGVL